MKHRFALLTATLVLLLAACATTVLFDLSGTYSVTGTITESTSLDLPEGEGISDTFIVTVSGDLVTVIVSGDPFTAPRNGNTVTIANSTSIHAFSMTLTWTSDTSFEGSGRTDDLVDETYWEYDLTGNATVSI